MSAFVVSCRTSFARTQRRRQSWRVAASWRCRSPNRPARHHRRRAVREQVGCCQIRLLHCRIPLSRSRPLADSKQQPQPLPPAAVCQSQTDSAEPASRRCCALGVLGLDLSLACCSASSSVVCPGWEQPDACAVLHCARHEHKDSCAVLTPVDKLNQSIMTVLRTVACRRISNCYGRSPAPDCFPLRRETRSGALKRRRTAPSTHSWRVIASLSASPPAACCPYSMMMHYIMMRTSWSIRAERCPVVSCVVDKCAMYASR